MPPSISIIVPAYNEAVRLGKSLGTILEYLNAERDESELIVVDDGSSDDTLRVAEESLRDAGRVRARVIPIRPNRGKGYAVRTGLLAASAPVALFTDADLSTPITETPKLVSPIERGVYDLTFGSRALDRSLIGVHQPWRREQGGRVINLIVRLATGLPFWDTQCGFKAFRMAVCQPLAEVATIERFGFDVEYLSVAHLAGLRLREIPVRWDHNEGSKLSVWRDTPRLLAEVRTIRRQARRGLYDQAIAAVRARQEKERARPLDMEARDSEPSALEDSAEVVSAAPEIQ
ncbi:MAG TPA: dolichyl-phosphate beta-glucosyltransferase [Pyrinomonadaceae bacterium]|jgi:glycosyltransferase involved in cell wall biosynthesis|nr:dolichyl-phosphate beta-glucosyltransferase [Pyrinomonadaceae bacterium]